MMIQAVLGNPHHPEYGVATIPLPIPRDQYAHCMELLEALEIGDAVKADCKVEKVDSFYTVLKRTEMLTVNHQQDGAGSLQPLHRCLRRQRHGDHEPPHSAGLHGSLQRFQQQSYESLLLCEKPPLIGLRSCCNENSSFRISNRLSSAFSAQRYCSMTS